MNILITGGSGMVGQQLITLLEANGFATAILSTKKNQNPNSFYWNLDEKYVDPAAIQWADSIIHLAGAGIVDAKWTDKRKQVLKESRVDTALLLLAKAKEVNKQFTSFISASGIGYYGTSVEDVTYTETSPAGLDFVSQLCVQWENAATAFEPICTQVAIFRIGIVLSKKGGALPKLAMPIKMGFGANLGTGKQIIPWIHINDLCNLFLFALQNKTSGIYNAIADEQPTNAVFNSKITKVLKKIIWLPNVPAFVLKIFLGERANLLLKGNKISSEKIKGDGFEFKYNQLEQALETEYLE